MRVLIDTGIWLRLFDKDDAAYTQVRAAIRWITEQHIEMVTTQQNVAEYWNVSTRPKSARGGLGQSLKAVERRVRKIEWMSEVVTESQESYQEWRNLCRTYSLTGLSVHDARLVAVMLVEQVRYVVTLNDRDFRRYAEIEPVTPLNVGKIV